MGYTHSWSRPRIISPVLFSAITEEFTRMLPALTDAGVELANPFGFEQPEITPEFIGFNGVAHCGHTPNPAVRLPWPLRDAGSIGSNQEITSGSLPFRCCNGDCSYESLWWERCVPEDRAEGEWASNFTKTAFRPYDLAVTAFLLIAKHHLGRELSVDTDGEQAQWEDAAEI